jgi:RNA polymerase sigma-70 factor, ECF subfamily
LLAFYLLKYPDMKMSTQPNFTIKKFESAICNELPTLEKMALWYTGDPNDAEDLVQDTVVLAIRFQESYRNGSNLRAWLLKVMRNRYISLTRRQKLERRVYESEAEHALTDWSMSETVRRNRERGGGIDMDDGFSDSVAHALNSLRPEFKAVVLMCDIDELTYVEAAKKVDCPVGTIMSRLHRGRRALKDMLGSKEQANAA